jgi:glycosyltransferase involved in cell wall biosynthesis
LGGKVSTAVRASILHTEASLGWGGQEIRIVQEALGMIRRGHRVIISAPEESSILKKARASGMETFPLSFSKKNPASALEIRSLISREKIDIVNTHSSSDSWVATLGARLSGQRPAVIRTRHLSTPIGRSLLSRLIYDILPDAVMTTGEEIRQRMVSVNGFDGSKIWSVPTGIDVARFDPARVGPAFSPAGFTVGMIGVLRSWKGHEFFLRAAPLISERIPAARFYIVGDGPQRLNIERMIGELSLEGRVILLGHREDVPEIMASLDVVVQPSYANEGVPQSVLQALAMERPVVASDAGAISEVVLNGKTGLLVGPRNPEQLAEKVLELYLDPELRRRLGAEGRILVLGRHTFEAMLDRVEALYEMLMRSRKRLNWQ